MTHSAGHGVAQEAAVPGFFVRGSEGRGGFLPRKAAYVEINH